MAAHSQAADLQPFSIPLDGVTLIEASAGTGKTYNITSLYVRQLLERGLSVDQILVVTFTKDATEELRERIRTRVLLALKIIQSDDLARYHGEDPELAAWLGQRTDDKALDENRLRAAVVSMDEAAVFTIHGFCQRMLQDNAFYTGMPFELEFIENEEQLRQQAAEDFWRHWFGNKQLDSKIAMQLVAEWKNPEALLGAVSARIELDGIRLLPVVDSLNDYVQLRKLHSQNLLPIQAEIKQSWPGNEQAVIEILTSAPGLFKVQYKAEKVHIALTAVAQICQANTPPEHLDKLFEILSQSFINSHTTKKNEPPQHPFFELCERYFTELSAIEKIMEGYKIAFMYAARSYIKKHISQAKSEAQQLYFNDLLTELNEALQSVQGPSLGRQIFSRFPVAMIDEFQDTDTVQYQIFSTIYAQRGDKPGGLYLIGDPKQAIYSFRGGDIFTYMQAAKDAQQHYSLATNWRSSSRLISAVNILFSVRPDVFVQAAIQYQPVRAAPVADEKLLTINGLEPVPLQVWKLKLSADNETRGAIRSSYARQEAANHCANHMVALLGGAEDVRIGKEPLCAKDIAVLVRTHAHASLIQDSLRKKGINSVTLSDDSVFESPEATALLNLLQSLAETNDEKFLRYVLAGRLFGMTANELKALQENEKQLEQLQQRFAGYRYIWKDKGFMPAMQHLFKQEGIARRLLNLPDGERRLTNLLQLLELSQQAAKRHPGSGEMLRWLSDEIEHSSLGDASRLRLESDEGLIKIVTMHASKGLEYPVVYIPFPWHPPNTKNANKNVFYHDANQQPTLYFGKDTGELSKAKAWYAEESLAEDIRLLYVSMTRAAKMCVLCMGKVNGANSAALPWLLFPGEGGKSTFGKCTQDELFARLDELAKSDPDAITVCDPPADMPAIRPNTDGQLSNFKARLFNGKIEQNWWVNSYSSLTRGKNSEQPDYDAVAGSDLPPSRGSDEIQALPAGPGFGIFMHELFEQLDFARQDEMILREQILVAASTNKDSKIDESNVDAMLKMVTNVLATRLPAANLCLQDLSPAQRVDEMEFYFSVQQLSYHKLQQTLATYPAWQDAAAQLNFPSFQGMMHGYIDLVFRHDGRYYLADYKSNRLDDYAAAGLNAAMGIHYYPLQGLIYSLALHRYLRQRLVDYDYGKHFGGLYYLFTRGMQPDSENGLWYRRPEVELIQALDDCFGVGQ